jgi:hypothetical protein
VSAASKNRDVQRRQTKSRTTIVEGVFGVVLPNKTPSDGKNMHVVCSTTDDPGTGLIEIYDSKTAVTKTMPRLTVRLKNIVGVKNSVIRQKLHVVVEDATRMGKPLMLTTNNPARRDALVLFLGQPVAPATQQSPQQQRQELTGTAPDQRLTSFGADHLAMTGADCGTAPVCTNAGPLADSLHANGHGIKRDARKPSVNLGLDADDANAETRL